jgi:hypothetical protein
MNVRKVAVVGVVAVVALFFYLAVSIYQSRVQTTLDAQVDTEQSRLVRMHSPVFGPQGATVTVVVFFLPRPAARSIPSSRACWPSTLITCGW